MNGIRLSLGSHGSPGDTLATPKGHGNPRTTRRRCPRRQSRPRRTPDLGAVRTPRRRTPSDDRDVVRCGKAGEDTLGDGVESLLHKPCDIGNDPIPETIIEIARVAAIDTDHDYRLRRPAVANPFPSTVCPLLSINLALPAVG